MKFLMFLFLFFYINYIIGYIISIDNELIYYYDLYYFINMINNIYKLKNNYLNTI